MISADVIVIGGGPGGLAAAASAAREGASVMLLEREKEVGGILNQCIHDGFGLVKYTEQLSGPEYAARAIDDAKNAGVDIRTSTTVVSIDSDLMAENGHVVRALNNSGAMEIHCKSIVLATGCRERTRGMIAIPGSRPAGIYTAGVAQNLMNMKNIMVGRKVVILGTGDIGLIMARRLTLEGAQVICALEIQKNACGLSRNVRQCLEDYHIPVYLSHTVTNVIGNKRLEAVEVAALDESGHVIESTKRIIECDTLILSVGLIPENEVAETAGVRVDSRSNGAVTDKYLQTSIAGVFACGNCRSVMDLADFVSEQGQMAGVNAAAFTAGKSLSVWEQELHNAARKGMPKAGTVTCTLCPKGCELQVDGSDNVSGNGCPKGIEFALAEQHAPKRILTTTVKISGAKRKLLPVRSDSYVYLDEIKDIVKEIGNLCIASPINAGDVIVSGVGRNEVNIIAQCDM